MKKPMERMKPRKFTVDEMTRLAFVYAEQDRESWIEAHVKLKDDPEYAEMISENEQLVSQIRQYRLKRWGRGSLEKAFDGAKPVPINEVIGRKN